MSPANLLSNKTIIPLSSARLGGSGSRSRNTATYCKAGGSLPKRCATFLGKREGGSDTSRYEHPVRFSENDVDVPAQAQQTPVKTIALIGKDGAGKTRLVAELTRLENSKDGDAASASLYLGQPSADQLTREEDSSHFNTTLHNHLYSVECPTHRLQLVDCPGHIERLPQVDMALRVADGAVFVVGMTSGVDESAERVWQRLRGSGKPGCIFISQVDKGGMDNFESCVESVRDQFDVQPVVLQYPYYDADGNLVGLVDVLNKRFVGEQGCLTSENIPDDAKESSNMMFRRAVEALAEGEVDEEIMEAYLDEVTPSQEVLHTAVKKASLQGSVIPILCGSSAKGMGADALNEFLASHLPAQNDDSSVAQWVTNGANGDVERVVPDPEGTFAGYVFGTHWDRYAGKCCDVLVLRGKLSSSQKLVQSETNSKFSTQKLMRWSGVGKLEPVEGGVAYPGDFVVLSHCDDVQVNHTLSDPNSPVVVESVHFEKPRCTYKLDLGNSNSPSDDEKILGALHKIIEEDPSVRLVRNEETNEFLLSGMGGLHMEVIKERIREDFSAEICLSTPHVAYHETPTKPVTAEGRHKKQSGGHGQFGIVNIKMEPLERDAGVQFVSMIKGGVIPKTLISSVERGVRDALKTGPMGNFPVVDVKVTLFDGKTHSVDSGDAAFYQAGTLAIRWAFKKCQPSLLEPTMMVKIDVPETHVGTISKDLSRRRGQVLTVNPNGHMSIVEGLVPLSTMLTYSDDLQQMTAGLGCFTMELETYQEVPPNLVKAALAEKAEVSS